MNELKATINFTKQTFVINGVDLISGDYNSTKITFNFEDSKEGTKILEIRPKDSEDKNPTFMGEIINNEVILVSKDSEEHNISPFTDGGVYLLEVSVYGDDSKLSTITKSINVLEEQIILSDDIVTPYLPIFDELIQEINTAITETNNLNISITKADGVTTVTLTKKDGTTNTVTIKDGVDGVGIESISKISTSGLVDTYRITLTDDSYYDYQVVNGANGTDGKGIASINKTSTSGLVDTYTITYTDGTTSTFQVTNGEDGEVTQAQLDETNRAIDYYKLTLNALPKVEGEGTSLTLDDTAEAPMKMSLAPSELSQDGEPTPETPQDIHTISGDNEIKVENKNLVEAIITHTNISSEGVIVYHNDYDLHIAKIVQGKSYTMTTTVANDKVLGFFINYPTINSNTYNNFRVVQSSYTFTAPITGYVAFRSSTGYTTPMLNEGDTALSYEPHEEQSLPLNLGDLEYCKIGDYEDEFIYNTTDTSLELNKWYLKKNITKATFNNFSATDVTNLYMKSLTNYLVQNAISTHFVNVVNSAIASNSSANSILSNEQFSFRDGSTKDRMYVKTTLTIEQLNALGATFYYVTNNPTYIPLNDTLQSQLTEIYKWVKAYQDQTNISQVNNDLPFVITASAIKDISNL